MQLCEKQQRNSKVSQHLQRKIIGVAEGHSKGSICEAHHVCGDVQYAVCGISELCDVFVKCVSNSPVTVSFMQ